MALPLHLDPLAMIFHSLPSDDNNGKTQLEVFRKHFKALDPDKIPLEAREAMRRYFDALAEAEALGQALRKTLRPLWLEHDARENGESRRGSEVE